MPHPVISTDRSEDATVAPTAAEMRRSLWRTYGRALTRYNRPGDGILARSVVPSGAEWTRTEPCALNTAEVLKALFAMRARGVDTPLDPSVLMMALVEHGLAGADYQVISLALWAASVGRQSCTDLLFRTLCERIPRDASQSMPLAWTLSALSAYAPLATDRRKASAVAQEVFDRLRANQHSSTGLFFTSGRREGWLRKRPFDATLSSQIYPVLAFASFSQVFDSTESLRRAKDCADTLRALQGAEGQWWLRYDVRRGIVSQPYPVYCVNQDGAVPAAFSALQQAVGGTSYDAPIERGLMWECCSQNEISHPLVDEDDGAVIRSIEETNGGFFVTRELYAYQPARCLYSLMSDSRWAAEVAA